MSATSPFPDLRLVPLAPDDAPRLQAVYEATADYFHLVAGGAPPPGAAERALLEAAAIPDRHIMGIVLEKDLIGVLDFRLRYPAADTAYLGLLLLVPEARGKGYGSLAMEIWETWLSVQTPITRVRLGVVGHNRRAIRFWLARGYQFTGEARRVTVGAAAPRVLIMEKVLNPASRHPEE